MKTKQDYFAIQAEIDAIAAQQGHKGELTEYGVDLENVMDAGIKEDDAEFWPRMFASLCCSAGMRAEELGLDLNKLIGRIIY